MTINSLSSYMAKSTAEASETAAQTKAEAAKGDQQAVRKLARQQSTQAALTSTPPSAQGPTSRNGLEATA